MLRHNASVTVDGESVFVYSSTFHAVFVMFFYITLLDGVTVSSSGVVLQSALNCCKLGTLVARKLVSFNNATA